MNARLILVCAMVAACLAPELAFGAVKRSASSEKAKVGKAFTGPYGIRIEPERGCEKGARYILKKLKSVYLPAAVKYYGDPFGGKKPSRVFTIVVQRNDGSNERKYTGPSWGSCSDGIDRFTVGLAKGSDKWEMDLALLASRVLTVCEEDDGAALHIYANDFVRGKAEGVDAVRGIKEDIRKGLEKGNKGDEKENPRLSVLRELAPMWSVFEDLRKKHPKFILDYNKLKNSRFAEGKLPARLSKAQMVALLGEVTGEDMPKLLEKHGVKGMTPRIAGQVSMAKLLGECDFLLNEDFKKDAKVFLCLFSASWCPPCRREMPRIAKTYAETLKDDPDIELIHVSRDNDEDKALAWAKEHDVKFPVVRYNGDRPLDLHTRGIPHLFILKSDGTLVEEGHPMRLFTDEKIRELKADSSK